MTLKKSETPVNFTVTKSDILYSGKVFDLKIDEVLYDSGNTGVRQIAVHPGGAVIVPVFEDKLVLVNQFRYPFQKFMLEFPAGKLEINEDPYLCAVRELEEETGFTAEKIDKLGAIATAPGFCTEILHIYIALNLTPGETKREEGEFGMEIVHLKFSEIENKIKTGEIFDSKTISAFLMTKLYLQV
ncbi:MAG: NUDIX hydrolase [Ignavibacteriaceae bacterium]|nr:NUDIX hydrolase [Ignavibacteriaceae bacterium]